METDWPTLRATASTAFADTPSSKLEQQIIDAHAEDPARIGRLVERIIKAHQRKPFDSPWAVIRAQLEPPTAPEAKPSIARQRLIDHAKAWILNAGCHHPTWADCAGELFGTGAYTAPADYLQALDRHTQDAPGRPLYQALLQASINRALEHGSEPIPDDTSAPLYPLRDDQAARAELQAEWATHRVRALKAEAANEAWNAKAKADRQLILALNQRQKQQRRTSEPAWRTPDDDEDIDFDTTTTNPPDAEPKDSPATPATTAGP